MLEFKIGRDTASPFVKKLARGLSSGAQMRALVAGMNRTVRFLNTAATRAIQADVGASSQKTIRRNLSIHQATKEKPTAILRARSAKSDRIPLFELRPRPRQPVKRPRGAGVQYGPGGKLIPGSFVARMKSGHVGVFKRLGKARLPIAELFGPSVAWVFGSRKVQNTLKSVVDDRLPKEVDKALEHFTKV
jgi:hypothetical protein